MKGATIYPPIWSMNYPNDVLVPFSIDYSRREEGMHPTKSEVYSAMVIEEIDTSSISKESIRSLAAEHRLIYGNFTDQHLTALHVHKYALNKLENGVEFLLSKDGKIEGLIMDNFGGNGLDDNEYQIFIKNLIAAAKAHRPPVAYCIKVEKIKGTGGYVPDGIKPFYIGKNKCLMGKGSEEHEVMELLFLATEDPLECQQLIDDKEIVYIYFNEGVCESISFHEDKVDHARHIGEFIINLGCGTRISPATKPKVCTVITSSYNKTGKELIKICKQRGDGNEKNKRCVLS